MKLSLVIPVYNAEKIIISSVRSLIETLAPLSLPYEILLRDDKSTDGSVEVLKSLPGMDPRVRCFFNPANQGLGATLRELFRDARGEIVIYCDVDLPFGAKIIPGLLAEVTSSDIVTASRYRGEKNRVTWSRKAASRLYYGFCKFLWDIRVVDIGSGTVAIQKRALDQLSLRAKGFDIHAELYVKAAREGLTIKEIAAVSTDEGKGSFRVLKHGPRVAFETIRLWFAMRRDKRERQGRY
ncbi:MAG: hypothetical protein A2Z81_01715 [Omnitrophica WOR_2 bacterium GWA2_45_18]|nr:MAG: hypothetical protein A2Z81_01715 [Omnitrophica WOR_2 bacterium GWA2_45_18]